MNSFRRLFTASFLTLTLCAISRPLLAETWQNGGDNLWSNPLNWSPGLPNNSTPAVFDIAGSTTVDLGGASRDLQNLIFNASAQGYTLTGNAGDALNFSATGSIVSNLGIAGAETVNSAIKLNGGPFTVTNDEATKLLTLGGGISLASGTADLLTVNGAGNTTISGVVSTGAISGLTKSGAGTLTLSGANTYAGTTTILEGTVTTTTSNAFGTGGLVFGDGTTAATGTLNVTQNLSVGSLAVKNNDPSGVIASNINISAGKTMTVTGAVTVGNTLVDGQNTKLVVAGPGTFTINTTSNVAFGQYGNGGTTTHAVDLTGVGAFNLTSATFTAGGGASVRPAATTVLLSNTANNIVATTMFMSNSGTANGSSTTLTLGTGTNSFNVDSLTIGTQKSGGIMNFASSTPGSPGTVSIAGRNSAKANIILGDWRTGSSGNSATMDLRGHQVNISAGTLQLARIAGGTNGVAVFSFDDGNVSVDTLDIAPKSTTTDNTAGNGGTVNIGGGVFTVNTLFRMGSEANNDAGSTSTATVNITGGSVISNVDILEGTNPARVTSTLSLNGGTLDMTGHTIGSSTAGAGVVFNAQAGTLKNVASINGEGGLTKTTTGTLNVEGTSTITGPITVSAGGGTLNLQSNAVFSLGTGAVSVAGGTTLGLKAFSPSSSVITTTGAMSLGSGGVGATLNLTLAGNPTAPLLSGAGLTTSGTSTINLATTSALTSGTYKLIDYTGAIGGAGFAGLTTGTMPLRTSGTLVDNVANSSVDITLATDAIRWNGNVNSVWDINSTSNWKLITAGTGTTYQEPSSPGEPVRFDDNASGNFNVNVSTAVNPVSVTFDNSTNNYMLSGTGNLTTPTLVKSGTGTTTIATSGALNISTMALNGTGAVIIDRTDNPTLATALTGTGKLQKVGTNDLTLSGNSTGFLGSVDIAAGTIKLGSSNALGSSSTNISAGTSLNLNGQTLTVGSGGVGLTGTGPVTTSTGGTVQLASGGTVSTNAITGNATVRVNASGGTATMSGGDNTYSGQTQLVSGTLALVGGNNRLPTSTTLAFNPDNVASAAATLDLGSTNQTLNNLTTADVVTNSAASTLNITGTGTLTLGATDLNWGAAGPSTASYDTATGVNQTINMSALSNFVYNGGAGRTFSIGNNNSNSASTKQTQVATVTFGTNATITATQINFARDGGGSGGGKTTVFLGQTNVWNAGSIAGEGIGMANGARSDLAVQFAAGLVNPTLKIRALDGTSALPTFAVGNVSDTSNRLWDQNVDLSGGSVDALVSQMVVGAAVPSSASRAGTLNTLFTMGAGTFSVNSLTVGQFAATAPGNGTNGTLIANGTFTLNNAAGTLDATTITLADVPEAVATGGTTKSTTGTLAILNGVVKANTITRGSQVGVITGGVVATPRVDFSGGTIQNMDGLDLAINDVEMRLLSNTGARTIHVTGSNTATANAGTVVSDVGSLTKSGTGTLVFQGANTYAGNTTISGGTLLVNGTHVGGAAYTVGSGGVLGGTGTINSPVTVNSGGAIAPGASIESIDLDSLTLDSGSLLNFELGAPGTADLINVLGANGLTANGGTFNFTNAGGLAAGSYTLIDYVGTLGGAFNNLGVGMTQPPGFAFALVDNVANTSIDLQVTTAGIAGDYNNDGKVNAADYVLWRKNPLAFGGTPGGYNTWRANFGNPPGAGSGSGLDGGAVPEPAACGLVLCAVVGAFGARRRRAGD